MTSPSRRARSFVVAGFAAFFAIGGLQAVYGPALPGLRARFDVPLAASSAVLSAHFVGALAAVLACGALSRVALGVRLAVAAVLVAAGALSLAFAARWGMVVAGAGVIGLGYGALVIDLNTTFARAFGERSGALVAVLNGVWGVGAATTPIVLGERAVENLPRVAAAGAVVALVAAYPLSRAALGGAATDDATGRAPPGGRRLRVLGGFSLVLFLYAGVENGVGGWEATHLAAVGIDPTSATRAPALFWAALTAGRLLVAPIALRVRASTLVLASFASATVLLALARATPIAPFAYAAAGLALAPVFPSAIVWLVSALPSMRAVTSPAVAAACVGGATLPAAIGWSVEAAGSARAIPTALAIGAAAALLVAALLPRRGAE